MVLRKYNYIYRVTLFNMKKVYSAPLIWVAFYLEQTVVCGSGGFDDNVPIVDGQNPEGDTF